jgi:hypothetical protein
MIKKKFCYEKKTFAAVSKSKKYKIGDSLRNVSGVSEGERLLFLP